MDGLDVLREEYDALTEQLGKGYYLPFSGTGKFVFSAALSQHILNLPREHRDIIRAINKDITNIYNYEYEVEECSMDFDFYHIVIKVDLLVLICGYYVDTETLETKYAVLEILQGIFD